LSRANLLFLFAAFGGGASFIAIVTSLAKAVRWANLMFETARVPQSDVSDRARLPHPVIIYAAVGILLFVVALGLMWEAGLSAPGQAGPAGVQGPPGPPGPPDASIAIAVKSLARAYELDREVPAIVKLSDEYDVVSKSFLSWYFSPNAKLFSNEIMVATNHERQLIDIENRIAETVHKDLGENIDLTRHPNFDLNHFMDTPDGDKITDLKLHEEYTRYFDQITTARRAIDKVITEYQTKSAAAHVAVSQLAK